MLRLLALCLLFGLAAVVAGCGDDDSSSVTPTVPPLAATSPGSPTDTPVTTTTAPTATPSSPTPTPLTNWTIGGQVSGASFIDPDTCTGSGNGQKITLRGHLNEIGIGIIIETDTTGTIDFSQPNPAVKVAVQYGGPISSVDDYWFGLAGDPGTAGTITLDADGNGGVEGLTVPPSTVDPGGATAPITFAGPLVCST
jgi:hypothetical protein